MPRFDDDPVDVQMRKALEALDATLAGEPVDPAQAELAELALILADERPAISAEFSEALDRAVQRRFDPAQSPSARRPSRVAPALRHRWWLWTPAAGLAAALVAAVVIVAAGGNGRPAEIAAAGPAAKTQTRTQTSSAPARSAATAPSVAAAEPAAGAPPGVTLAPPANGRKIIQGAQLALTTASSHIDTVAQEVFVVIGQVRGIVLNSTVTATGSPGGYAQFQLSIPSSMLPQAMASLSSLRYAKVASRTDTTQDVNDQYEGDVRALADARALRTSLLRQLAGASTQAQNDSLTARIHDAEASISSDEATLRSLNRQIGYSQVGLTVNAGSLPVPVTSGGAHGFGLGQAAHDAGRVLTVAAGIALIGAAAAVPLGLLGALAWSIAAALRRRRRDQALDLV